MESKNRFFLVQCWFCTSISVEKKADKMWIAINRNYFNTKKRHSYVMFRITHSPVFLEWCRYFRRLYVWWMSAETKHLISGWWHKLCADPLLFADPLLCLWPFFTHPQNLPKEFWHFLFLVWLNSTMGLWGMCVWRIHMTAQNQERKSE